MTANDAAQLTTKNKSFSKKTIVNLIIQIEKRIQLTNNGENDLLWSCPLILEDLPLFNVHDVCRQIAKHFTKHGFFVRFRPPNKIYVSWRHCTNKKKAMSKKKT